MKKFIALILALIMTFSIGTVAFAQGEADAPADTETTAPVEGEGEGEEEAAGELDWILDLPFWTVGPAFKFAKIALKLVKVYIKVAAVFGIIDTSDIISQIVDMITNAENSQPEAEETTAPAVEDTTAPVAA